MTDSTHNALVTVMIIIAVIIAIALLTGRLGRVGYSYHYYQPASVIDIGQTRVYNTQPRYSSTVTSYSRPSTYTTFGSTQTTTTYATDTKYTYDCSPDGTYCWTNQ